MRKLFRKENVKTIVATFVMLVSLYAMSDESLFAPTDDNFMLSDVISRSRRNWGVYPEIAVGLNDKDQPYRSLMRFDIASLGASTSITSATIRLTVTSAAKLQQSRGNFDLKLFLLDNANKDWVEGTKNAALAAEGESCWRFREYDTEGWIGGAGIGNSTDSAGVAAQLATALIDADTIAVGDKITYYIESEEGLAALERWADGGVNEGFLLTTDEASSGQNALMVGSREHPTQSYRPVLSILLEPVIPQGTVILIQ